MTEQNHEDAEYSLDALTQSTAEMSRFFFSLLLFQAFALTLAFIPLQSHDHLNHTHFLQDVLKEIAIKQSWDLDQLSFSKLQLRKVRVGVAQAYEFWIRFGKSQIVFKFPVEVASWTNFSNAGFDFGDLVKEAGSLAVLDSFKLEGPFELRVSGDADDSLSLLLPMNTSFTGLKTIRVGEGISVEVVRAREVSVFYTLDLGLSLNKGVVYYDGISGFWSFWRSLCMPLLPIRISGSASLVAYRTRNPDSYIETTSLSEEAIELLSEKCHSHRAYKQVPLIDSLALRIGRLEKILKSSMVDRTNKRKLLGFLNAKLKASTIVRFQLELERNRSNDEQTDWRTRPRVERLWFEVMARIEGQKLMPLMVKKVTPFVGVDSAAWSSLMSNISFTKFPSILVPQEALTLDVKW